MIMKTNTASEMVFRYLIIFIIIVVIIILKFWLFSAQKFCPKETFFIFFITDARELYSKCDLINVLHFLFWTNCLSEVLVELLPHLLLWYDCFLSYCFQEWKKKPPENQIIRNIFRALNHFYV